MKNLKRLCIAALFFLVGISTVYSADVPNILDTQATARSGLVGNAIAIPDPVLVIPLTDSGAGVVNTTPSVGITPVTFTRATSAWTILSGGTWGLVASGSPRSYYTPSGVYLGYLSEKAATNLTLQSQDFSNASWSNLGTPTLSSGTTTLGALSLDTLGDDTAATAEGKFQTITFTGNTNKAISLFVKKGTATSGAVRIRDNTALADRLLAVWTWSGTVPVVAMTTGLDLTGTPEQFGSSGVYRLFLKTTSITAANSNFIAVYPATDATLAVANTGTVEVGGIQAEDALAPSTYIPTTTTTVTRNGDFLDYTTSIQSPASMYCESTSLTQGLTVEQQHLVVLSTADLLNGYAISRQENAAIPGPLQATVKMAVGNQAAIIVGTFAVGVTSKSAASFALNDVAVAKDGVAGPDATLADVPTPITNLTVGSTRVGGAAQQPNAAIQNVKVWNVRIPTSVDRNITF